MSKWVDISTVIAAAAGLWALAFAWLTYVMSVRQESRNEFFALRSIADGLRVELNLMRPWTGAGGQGYLKNTQPPDEWSEPGRLIWKFDIAAISNLTNSPYLYRLHDIVVPFVQLNFSVSKLFQLYDEYRNFVNSNPVLLTAPPDWSKPFILKFNVQMHVDLIGGADSDNPMCLYKTYENATAALLKFGADLAPGTLPWWFWFGHLTSAACFASGAFLLFRLFRP